MSFRKRDGVWRYRYDITDPATGKRKQKESKGFKTKAAAVEESVRIKQELITGTYIEEKDITFEMFASQWLEIYESSGRVKVSTVKIRRKDIARIKPYFEKLQMKKITRLIYQNAINALKKYGYADNTINSVHRTGRMIFNKAVELEVI